MGCTAFNAVGEIRLTDCRNQNSRHKGHWGLIVANLFGDQGALRQDSGRRRTQLRGCPPSFVLLLDAAALSATPT